MELKTFYHFDISEIAEKFECDKRSTDPDE